MSEAPVMSPRIAWNNKLANAFIAGHKTTSRYPKVSAQAGTEPLDITGLKPFGYNPAVIEDNGFMVMAYRHHHEPSLATQLMLAQVDPTGEILSNRVIVTEANRSAEDPKFFHHDEELYMSFVISSAPITPFRSVVRYGKLINGRLEDIKQPNIGRNDWSIMEKNWVFFSHQGRLHCIHHCHPQQQIYCLDDGEPVNTYETEGPRWDYGPIKGGTPPIEFNGNYLRFFHSTLDNEFGTYNRRYFVGACTMAAKPPFQVLRVSKRPILFGSEIDNLKVRDRPFHWKANVVFPGGIAVLENGFAVSVGVNDSACLLVKITPEMLKL